MNGDSASSSIIRNILHLTDFSSCSDVALQWAMGIAKANEARLSVVHVVVPDALIYLTPASPTITLDFQEQWARKEMQRIKTRLVDLRHDTIVMRGTNVWSAVEPKLKQLGSELIVLGTHGRTGLTKRLMGSVAEEIFRSSAVPVLTVGPKVANGRGKDGKFHQVLLAADFTAESAEATGYAVAFARRSQARLVLLHARKNSIQSRSEKRSELSVAELMHRLYETIPCADGLRERPETVVEYGEPGARILEVARRKEVDLIVMGIRSAGSVFAATHLDAGTAHKVVAEAPCPVLTVRANAGRLAQRQKLSLEPEKCDEGFEKRETAPPSLSA